MKYAIGLDLGGSKIGAGLVSSEGQLVYHNRYPTPTEAQFKSVRHRIHAVVDTLALATADALAAAPRVNSVRGIGLASAGPLNLKRGELVHPANFAGWKIVPLTSLLRQALSKNKISLPLRFQNDAVAAALAEGWRGAARGRATYAVITLGTGIGTGIILNHEPAQSLGMGCEWGHQLISLREIHQNSDIHVASVEGFASGTGMLRRAQALGFTGTSLEDLVAAVRAGHEEWRVVFDDAAKALAVLFYNLSLGFHPERIIISGGLIKVRDLFFDQAQRWYREWIRAKNPAFFTRVSVARFGSRAGVVGAARLIFPHNSRA